MVCPQFPNVRTKTVSKYIPAEDWEGDRFLRLKDRFSTRSYVKTGSGFGFTGTRSSPLILVSLTPSAGRHDSSEVPSLPVWTKTLQMNFFFKGPFKRHVFWVKPQLILCGSDVHLHDRPAVFEPIKWRFLGETPPPPQRCEKHMCTTGVYFTHVHGATW